MGRMDRSAQAVGKKTSQGPPNKIECCTKAVIAEMERRGRI